MSEQTCGQCFTVHSPGACPSPAGRLDPTASPRRETPIVHRSRCGCVHDQDGHCLMVCSTHTEVVEGRVGVRLRTLNGELAFFALAPEEARPLPTAADGPTDPDGVRWPSPPPTSGFARTPEESLCGEEESFAAGSFAIKPDEPSGVPLDTAPMEEGLRAWEAHCRRAGRNRVRAYVEAFGLVGMHLDGWGQAFPRAANEVLKVRELPPMSERERMLVHMAIDGMRGALQELTEVANRVVERR